MKYWITCLATLSLIQFAVVAENSHQIPIGQPEVPLRDSPPLNYAIGHHVPPTSLKPPEQKPIGPSKFWYEAITHNGEASFMPAGLKSSYKVYRNVVTDFGADNTGKTDASDAIQKAINAGAVNGPDRTQQQENGGMGLTWKPAIVYLPSGTYMMSKAIQLYMGTVLVGDPTNPPTLKAIANFVDNTIVYGKDPNFHDGTVAFYTAIKNIVIDSTNKAPSATITLLDWTVSQATQLSNVVFNMPDYSSGHVGLSTGYGSSSDAGYNSNTILNDLTFNGGVVGMSNSEGQQWAFKGLSFNRCTTGVKSGGTNVVFTSCSFTNCSIGIDATGTGGSVVLLDSTGVNTGTLVSSYGGASIILENIQNDKSNTVSFNGGDPAATFNVPNTWVHGQIYSPGNTNNQWQDGSPSNTPRSSALLQGGRYFTMKPPAYQNYTVDQVINIKLVDGLPVFGNGVADDSANINAILSKYAGSKVIYFPAGTYIVKNTITIPVGSRIFGDAYASAISALGSSFGNSTAPTAMVQVGNPNDVGVAQISDMLFTVADVLPGCKLVEVNMAGQKPGDVGIWNSHFRVGGADGSKVRYNCAGPPANCKAAWGLLHLTNSSSAYIENMWGWTADHDLDGGPGSYAIAVGRGALIEATKGTWLVGTAMEHNTLYQYNMNNAANVFSAMQQSETPYWQGASDTMAPQPWKGDRHPTDPTFSNCQSGQAQCAMAWFEVISGSHDLFLYGGCVWAFFNDGTSHPCGENNPGCQNNAVDISNSSSTYLYGTNVHDIATIFRSDGRAVATSAANGGGWGGVVAAYLFHT